MIGQGDRRIGWRSPFVSVDISGARNDGRTNLDKQEKELGSLIKLDKFVMAILGLGAMVVFFSGAMLQQTVLGLGGFFLISLMIAYVAIRMKEKQRRLKGLPAIREAARLDVLADMANLERDFEGTTTVEDESGLPSFSAVRGGQPIKIRATVSNLIVSSTMPLGQFRLFICPESQFQKNFRNVVDVQVGDRRFDARFAIQTNDSAKARSFLNKQILAAIEELADEVEPKPFGVTFNAGQVHFSIPLDKPSSKTQAVQKCLTLLEILQQQVGIWTGKAVLDILPTKKTEDVASCLVCGDHIKTEKVKCRSCRTAHHRECWEYIGYCSVFGCGSKRFDL